MARNVALTNEPPRGTAQKIQKWASKGGTKTSMARALGVSKETFNAWLSRHPDLSAAYDAGRDEEHEILHAALMTEARGGNIAAIIFALKARHNYREHAPIETPQAQVSIVLPGAMPREQYKQAVIEHEDANAPAE